jgi:hypothetical protein
MGINQFASRRTYKALTVADETGANVVANAEPVQVCGFIVYTLTADTTWTAYDTDDATLFSFMITAAKTTQEFTIPWMADNGFKLGNDKGTGSCTVFHNSPGN